MCAVSEAVNSGITYRKIAIGLFQKIDVTKKEDRWEDRWRTKSTSLTKTLGSTENEHTLEQWFRKKTNKKQHRRRDIKRNMRTAVQKVLRCCIDFTRPLRIIR